MEKEVGWPVLSNPQEDMNRRSRPFRFRFLFAFFSSICNRDALQIAAHLLVRPLRGGHFGNYKPY